MACGALRSQVRHGARTQEPRPRRWLPARYSVKLQALVTGRVPHVPWPLPPLASGADVSCVLVSSPSRVAICVDTCSGACFISIATSAPDLRSREFGSEARARRTLKFSSGFSPHDDIRSVPPLASVLPSPFSPCGLCPCTPFLLPSTGCDDAAAPPLAWARSPSNGLAWAHCHTSPSWGGMDHCSRRLGSTLQTTMPCKGLTG